MTVSVDTILAFDRRSSRATVGLAALAGAASAVPVLIGGLTVLAVLDRALNLPSWLRVALWLAVAGASAAAFATSFRPPRAFRAGERARTLSLRARSRGVELREDDLRLAVELARDGRLGSGELRDLYLEHIAGQLTRCRSSWSSPERRWSRSAGLAIAVVGAAAALSLAFPSLSPFRVRILNPFISVNLDRYVRVTPGDARVPLGSDVEIRIELLNGDSRPELMVRSATGWSRRLPDVDGKERLFLIRNLVEPLIYRVRWKGDWSRRYTISPIEPVRLSGFEVTVQPPGYTGKTAMMQTSPEITALAGSQVKVAARANRALKSASVVFSDGRTKPVDVSDGVALSLSFAVEKSGTYGFALVPAGEATDAPAAGQTESYPINVVEDHAPEILLLSPSDALVAGEREKIPVTFDVRDDIQVADVRLEWEVKGRARSVIARRFEARSAGGIFTYSWDLRAVGLRPGDAARYRLVASDANTVTGPGVASTPWMDVAVESFEREHEALGQALETWRDWSIDLLAQMTTLKAKVEKPDSNLEQAASDFNQSSQLSNQLEGALRQIVTRMENDPLADYGVTREHRAMLESMHAMNQSLMPSARAAINTQNRPAAAAQLENIASELERMTSLSEDLTKRQNARDVVESGERLKKLGEELSEALASAQPNDPALASKLNEVMDEARKTLSQLARALQQMPDQLPEDFVNQQALKSVQLGQAQDMLSQISDAIRRGDMKKAVELAQQFLQMTRSMSKSLSQAEEGFSKSGSEDELAQKIAEHAQKVDKLANDQRAVLAETQKLETARLERRMKSQEDTFRALAARQRAAALKMRSVAVSAQQTAFYVPLASQVGAMDEVGRELESRRVDKSFDVLGLVIGQLQAAEMDVARSTSTASLAEPVAGVRMEEAAILEELKKLRDGASPPLDSEKTAYDALKQRQETLARETGEVRQQLQALSRKTASLGLPVTQPLSKAAQEMKAAGGKLGSSDSRGALPHEEGALSQLLETQNGLAEAQAAMSEMAGRQGSGGGGGPRVIARPGGAGGRGSGNGRVRLPTADDYRPPREFREDLLESLKENYPKIYEDIIHRYYKRLAE